MDHAASRLWARAAEVDQTLRVPPRQWPALRERLVRPACYSRELLFRKMAEGEVVIFHDLPVRLHAHPHPLSEAGLASLVRDAFPRSQRACTQVGPSRTQRHLRVAEVIDRWLRSRALLGVTDLHLRRTRFDTRVDTSSLSDFNVLCGDRLLEDSLEMMTMVISSAGNFTDSHADDCDGSNHCFVGQKLWLAWDRVAGSALGFGDVDRDALTTQAAFDLGAFLSMKRSRWFLVGRGQTLCLPGHLAHKVITLERYIGLGSFHLGLPGALRALRRWILNDSLDVAPQGLLGRISDALSGRMDRLARSSDATRRSWGIPEARGAVRRWRRGAPKAEQERLTRHPAFARFVGSKLLQ